MASNNIDLINEEIVYKNWDELCESHDILRSIYRYGFEKPTPIQSLSIKPIIEGKDILAQAQSGTGKTGAFTVGSLHKVDISHKTTQSLMIAPTRELVHQIAQVVQELSSSIENIAIKTLVGGTPITDDLDYFKSTIPHVVVGTVGRVYDMINRRKLKTNNLRILVMDEADELLSRGFKMQIYDLIQCLPKETQIALFSATMPPDVVELGEKIAVNPVKISVKPEDLSLECICQHYVALNNEYMKYDTLKDLFSILQMNQTIVYMNSIIKVEQIYNMLREDGFPVGYIHGSLTKLERENALKKLRNGEFRILISSGITSRGIDIQQVSTVILYDIPRSVHTYLHSIGRSGRYGRKGLAINFVTPRDVENMRKIERYYKINISELPSNVDSLLK